MDISLYSSIYTSENNAGISFQIEILKRSREVVLEDITSEQWYIVVVLDNTEMFEEPLESEAEASQHIILRDKDNRQILGSDYHAIEKAIYFVDNLLNNWSETRDEKTISQKYFKSANSDYLYIGSYIGDRLNQWQNLRLYYTIIPTSGPNTYPEQYPLGVRLDTNTINNIAIKKNAFISRIFFPVTETTAVIGDVDIIRHSNGAIPVVSEDMDEDELVTETEEQTIEISTEPIVIPTMKDTYTGDSGTIYKLRSVFTVILDSENIIVRYKIEYGIDDYSNVFSSRLVTFSSEERNDIPDYMTGYARAEIRDLKNKLSKVDGTTLLDVDQADITTYSEPKTLYNVAIKNSKGQTFYVPLINEEDTNNYVVITQIPEQTNTLKYTRGVLQHPEWSSYDTSQIEISGDLEGIDAGTYYAIMIPKKGCMFEDGTTIPKPLPWVIQTQEVIAPAISGRSMSFAEEPVVGNYDSSILQVVSDEDNNAGNHSLKIAVLPEIEHNYTLVGDNEFEYTVEVLTIERPVASKISYLWTGQEITLETTYYPAEYVLALNITQTYSGVYTATFALRNNNVCWSDGGTDTHVIEWSIIPAKIPAPVALVNDYTYSPSVENILQVSNPILIDEICASDYYEQIGIDRSVGAGNFVAIYRLINTEQSYWTTCDTDGCVRIEWSVSKATPQVTLSTNSVTLNNGTGYEISVTRQGDGSITAISSDTNVATVSVSSNKVTVYAKGYGSTKIVVTINEGTNYLAETREISVTSTYLPPLSSLNPTQIYTILEAGKLEDTNWQPGDYFNTTLSGTVGNLTVAGTYRCVLLGINHNVEQEGSNRLHFMIGKNSSGKDICFVDSSYDTSTGFNHKSTGSNQGGWHDSNLRTLIQQFYDCMTDTLKEIITPCNKFTDIEGGTEQKKVAVMPVQDKIFLLSEYEILGATNRSNPEEANNQQQYDYFKTNSNLQRYKHSQTSKKAEWWLRSCDTLTNDKFLRIYGNSSVGTYAYKGLGIVPCFTIGTGQVTLLDSISWSQIQELITHNKISQYAQPGDTKLVTLNGTVGNIVFNNDKYRVTVLSNSHNILYEYSKRTHFALNKTEDNQPIVFHDSDYSVTSNSSAYFQHKNLLTNQGGWYDSNIRKNILAQFYECLPKQLRDIISTVKKHSDNMANSDIRDNVTITKDKLFLPSEFEVSGQRSKANSYEQNYQEQYDYFKQEGALSCGSYLIPTNKISWWLRSCDITTVTNYLSVSPSNTIGSNPANASLGIMPCFSIGGTEDANILEDMTWGNIASLASSNTLSDYAKIGDTKTLMINGTVGTMNISHAYKAVLIGINHNQDVEGLGKAHFAIALDNEDNDICIFDNHNTVSNNGTKYLQHNLTGASNMGGWQLSALRERCKEIYNSLEDELQSCIVLHPKYTNNYGGSPEDLSLINVTVTEDYIWLPSAYEISPLTNNNYIENNEQQTYEYFENHIKRKGHNLANYIPWWTRTPCQNNTNSFITIPASDTPTVYSTSQANKSNGIVPCFVLGENIKDITLEDLSWQQIQYYAQQGVLSRYAKPGDTKTIRLNGSFQAITLNSDYKAVLIGINHNQDVEGENTAHFAICKDMSDRWIAFVDTYYGMTAGMTKFHMTLSITGTLTWSTSYQYYRLQALTDIMPLELRSVIKTVPKYSDGIKAESKIWLLSTEERTGSASMENQAIYNYVYNVMRTQTFVAHNNSKKEVMWWTRSAHHVDNQQDRYYYAVYKSGTTYQEATKSLGIVPCFAI